MRKLVLLLILIGLLSGAGIISYMRQAGNSSPSPVVFDDAALFSPQDIHQAEIYHRHLLTNWNIDFRILTTRDGGDLNALSARKFGETRTGSHSSAGRGLLFTVNTSQDRVRIEVSAELEGVYTDAFVSYIERNMMVPYFKSNMILEGIMAATELVVNRAQEAESGIAFDKNRIASFTTGAGAVTDAHIGAGVADNTAKAGSAINPDMKLSPREAYEALLAMLARGEMVYDPLLYTQPSIDLFSKMPMPPAAISNMYNSYKACQIDAVKIAEPLAVLRFRSKDRKCGPMFFRRENGLWKFDLIPIRDIVIYDFQNNWGLKKEGALPYLFAFEDWQMKNTGKFLVP